MGLYVDELSKRRIQCFQPYETDLTSAVPGCSEMAEIGSRERADHLLRKHDQTSARNEKRMRSQTQLDSLDNLYIGFRGTWSTTQIPYRTNCVHGVPTSRYQLSSSRAHGVRTDSNAKREWASPWSYLHYCTPSSTLPHAIQHTTGSYCNRVGVLTD